MAWTPVIALMSFTRAQSSLAERAADEVTFLVVLAECSVVWRGVSAIIEALIDIIPKLHIPSTIIWSSILSHSWAEILAVLWLVLDIVGVLSGEVGSTWTSNLLLEWSSLVLKVDAWAQSLGGEVVVVYTLGVWSLHRNVVLNLSVDLCCLSKWLGRAWWRRKALVWSFFMVVDQGVLIGSEVVFNLLLNVITTDVKILVNLEDQTTWVRLDLKPGWQDFGELLDVASQLLYN
jgi:hypothetical protein